MVCTKFQRILIGLGLAVFLCLTLPAAVGQESSDKDKQERPNVPMDPTWGRADIGRPAPTTDGDWYGTWWYMNRDLRVGLWIRPGDGSPELRMQLLRLGTAERFTTDWQGNATYEARGGTGTFSLALGEGGEKNAEDELLGQWSWTLEFSDSSRREQGPVQIYRTGDGRQLVMYFDALDRSITRQAIEQDLSVDQAWTFRKGSRRLVLWDELPF